MYRLMQKQITDLMNENCEYAVHLRRAGRKHLATPLDRNTDALEALLSLVNRSERKEFHMTPDQIYALFEKHANEYIRHSRIKGMRPRRPDLHAFLLLDALVPGTEDMVSAAEHDEIFLDVSPDELAAADPTEAQVIELIRCGVRLDDDSLKMFV